MAKTETIESLEKKRKSGALAAGLNVLLPGSGYIYCGRVFLSILRNTQSRPKIFLELFRLANQHDIAEFFNTRRAQVACRCDVGLSHTVIAVFAGG